MSAAILTVCLLSVTGSFAFPASQPIYPNVPYITAQAIPNVQYRQQPQAYSPQPSYITAGPAPKPVFEVEKSAGLQKYSTQIKQPLQPVPLDRQIQRVAQSGGPIYLQQVQAVQEARDAAQRKVPSQTLAGQIQPVAIPLAVSRPTQPQYFRALPQQAQQQLQVGYTPANALQGYRSAAQKRPEEQERDPQEDYDPNPSYQFGFDVNDDLYTNYQNRKEQRENNRITGSYSVVDSDGFVRTVTYTADPKEGFKAEVRRQPTDIVVKIPKPDPQFQRLPQQQYYQNIPEQQRDQGLAQRQNLIQYRYQ